MNHLHETEAAKEQRTLNERIADVVDGLKDLSAIAAERFQDARKLFADISANPRLAGTAWGYSKDNERNIATVDAAIRASITLLQQANQSVGSVAS